MVLLLFVEGSFMLMSSEKHFRVGRYALASTGIVLRGFRLLFIKLESSEYLGFDLESSSFPHRNHQTFILLN